MTQIPVVDLEVALGDNPPRELLDEIRVAAEQIGIIQVVIPEGAGPCQGGVCGVMAAWLGVRDWPVLFP
jgi:hypothetical protein